jgi:myo-inositol-1(or 4)-monophosphatase
LEYNVLERAIRFAIDAHSGQLRKDGSPYILHPLEDAAIVGTLTDDLEVMAAAVLHDTVEDTPVTGEDILSEFGPRVCELVMHETENKRHGLPASETWQVRKEESLELLENTDDPAVRMLWMGDKLSNIRALHLSHASLGAKVFERFNVHDPALHKWYYGRVLELLRPLSDTDAYKEYARLYEEIFKSY